MLKPQEVDTLQCGPCPSGLGGHLKHREPQMKRLAGLGPPGLDTWWASGHVHTLGFLIQTGHWCVALSRTHLPSVCSGHAPSGHAQPRLTHARKAA